jgi:Na+/H+ antiporter NhaD/arsenite permease-like protein
VLASEPVSGATFVARVLAAAGVTAAVLLSTGSLSSYLWFKAARNAGAEPSAARFSRIGAPLAVAAMAAALLTGTR